MPRPPSPHRNPRSALSLLRRLAVLVVGSALCALGVLMIVLPGPGIPLLIVGFAVLSTEFVWAARILEHLRTRTANATAAAVATPSARRRLAIGAGTMITGGVIALTVLDTHVGLGIGTLLSGVGMLSLLHPATQRFLAPTIPSTTDSTLDQNHSTAARAAIDQETVS